MAGQAGDYCSCVVFSRELLSLTNFKLTLIEFDNPAFTFNRSIHTNFDAIYIEDASKVSLGNLKRLHIEIHSLDCCRHTMVYSVLIYSFAASGSLFIQGDDLISFLLFEKT
jgi:hypothetical protein